MERLNPWFFDQPKPLEELLCEDYQKKELKRYIKIRNILPIEYSALDYNEDKRDLITYLATKTDKRIKMTECYPSIELFHAMLTSYKALEWNSSTAIEVQEIKKEFSFIDTREIEKLLEKMNAKDIIHWESRGDLNQIRFH